MSDEATEEMDRRETQDRLVKLRAALAEVDAERGRLQDWQNEIAILVPEAYEGSEGSQESCIGAWINDLRTVASPFATELRAWDESGEGRAVGEIAVPVPADSREIDWLFEAADRLKN